MSPSPSEKSTTATSPEPSSPTTGTAAVTFTTAPRFLAPEPNPSEKSTPSPSSDASSAATAPDATAPAWSDAWPDDAPPEVADPSPSRKTGASRESSLADRKAIEEAAAAAVLTVTTLVHQRVAGDDPAAVELGVFLADEQDVAGISKPAAALVARRSSGLGGNPDLSDVIALGIAVAGYAVKQFSKLRALRLYRARGPQVEGFQTEPEAQP